MCLFRFGNWAGPLSREESTAPRCPRSLWTSCRRRTSSESSFTASTHLVCKHAQAYCSEKCVRVQFLWLILIHVYPGWSSRTQFEETWATLLGVLVTQPIALDQEEETQQEVSIEIYVPLHNFYCKEKKKHPIDWIDFCYFLAASLSVSFLPLSPGGPGAHPVECAGSAGHNQPGAECDDPAHCWQPRSQLSGTAAPQQKPQSPGNAVCLFSF